MMARIPFTFPVPFRMMQMLDAQMQELIGLLFCPLMTCLTAHCHQLYAACAGLFFCHNHLCIVAVLC